MPPGCEAALSTYPTTLIWGCGGIVSRLLAVTVWSQAFARLATIPIALAHSRIAYRSPCCHQALLGKPWLASELARQALAHRRIACISSCCHQALLGKPCLAAELARQALGGSRISEPIPKHQQRSIVRIFWHRLVARSSEHAQGQAGSLSHSCSNWSAGCSKIW